MATYNNEIKALFIDIETAEHIVSEKSPIAEMEIEYIDEDEEVVNTEIMEYYREEDDLIVLCHNDMEGKSAYISGRTAYGLGESAVRKDMAHFIRTERKHGSGYDMIVKEKNVPSRINLGLPVTVKRD